MALWGRKEENKYNQFIRERIREAREEKKMSQEELGKETHRSRISISNLESGRTEINAVDLMGIAYILEKPIRYFYPVYVPTENDLSDKEWELMHFFRQLEGNEAMQTVVIESAKQAAKIVTDADVQAMKRAIEEEQLRGKKTKK